MTEAERAINKRIQGIAGGGSPYEDGRFYYGIAFHDGEPLYLVSDAPIKICDENGIETGEKL